MLKLRPRAAAWAAAVLLLAHAVLAWLARAPGIGTGQDDAKYILLAQSLRHFTYQNIWAGNLGLHAQYPPGFPLLLAVLGAPFRDGLDWLIAINILLSVAALYLTWRVVRDRWTGGLALASLLALALNPSLIAQAGVLMSEPLFMALTMGALALLASEQPGTRRLALAGALAIAAALTRSAGTPIVGVVVLLWLMERRWKAAAAMGVASAASVGLWLAWTVHAASLVADHTSYVSGALDTSRELTSGGPGYFTHIARQVADYLGVMIPLALPLPGVAGTVVDNVIATSVVTVGLVAGLVVLWRRWRAAALFIVAELALLMVWPWTDTRFLFPLLPLLIPCLLAGVASIAGARRTPWGPPAAAALALLIATTSFLHIVPLVRQAGRCARGASPPDASCVSVDQASFLAAARYLAAHVPESAVVATAKPAPLYYYSGRRTLWSNELAEGPDSVFLPRVRRAGAEWILLSSLSSAEPNRILRRLNVNCDQLAMEAAFPPRTWLFRILPAASPDSVGCRALETYRRANRGRDFFAPL